MRYLESPTALAQASQARVWIPIKASLAVTTMGGEAQDAGDRPVLAHEKPFVKPLLMIQDVENEREERDAPTDSPVSGTNWLK